MKNARQRKLALSALGVAIAIPLIAVPASAGLDSGQFLIHAQNIDSPEYEATAGMRGLGSSEGGSGGPVTEGPVTIEPGSLLASYRCGPIDFPVNSGMVEFSKANEELVAQGKDDQVKVSSEGWSFISHENSRGESQLGFPQDGSKPEAFSLSTSSTGGFSEATKLEMRSNAFSGTCDALDLRKVPKSGESFSYDWFEQYDSQSGDFKANYSEGRYVQEDGSLIAMKSSQRAQLTGLSRDESPLQFSPVRSSTKPFDVTKYSSGELSLQILLKTPVDGYNYIQLDENSDGSGSVRYFYSDGVSEYGVDSTDADRKHGPTMVEWNSEGEIVAMAHSKRYLSWDRDGTVYTKDDYNSGSGSDWDGFFHKSKDFDISIPFEPVSYNPRG